MVMAVVNRGSEAYRRIVCAGFRIFDATVIDVDGEACAAGEFACVCGKREGYLVNLWHSVEGYRIVQFCYPNGFLVDVAALLEGSGAVSVEHLKNDGYSEDEIKAIRAVYN